MGNETPATIFYRGVVLHSHTGGQTEIAQMLSVVDRLNNMTRVRIEGIFSEHGRKAAYRVTVQANRWADHIEDDLRRAFEAAGINHNGIWIEGGSHLRVIGKDRPEDQVVDLNS